MINRWDISLAASLAFLTLTQNQVAFAEPVTFRDCAASEGCPLMVVIPPSPSGTRIGSPSGEDGRLESEHLHEVSVPRFALGKYEVSVGEYLACVEARGCRYPEWLEPGGAHNIETGSGVTYKSMGPYIIGKDQPVVGISWDDASAYATWLAAKSAKAYRLPSETEWEYAARAGTSTRFWWGDEPQSRGQVMGCCRGCGSELDGKGLFPVSAFKANPFGLHNMNGNVWEWVSDYFCEDYSSIPTDGSAQSSKQCNRPSEFDGLRIFRGGSCFYEPRQMRAAMRLRNAHDFRNQTVGFRVARSVSQGEEFASQQHPNGESK